MFQSGPPLSVNKPHPTNLKPPKKIIRKGLFCYTIQTALCIESLFAGDLLKLHC